MTRRPRTLTTELADAQAILAKLGNPSPLPTGVGPALDTSRTAHQQYLTIALAPQVHRPPPPNPPGTPADATAQLTIAAQNRAWAMNSDPTKSDPAWAQETGTIWENGNLLAFYRETFVPAAAA